MDQALLDDWRGHIRRLVYRLGISDSSAERDDLMSVGQVALWQAVERYGVSHPDFGAIATTMIRNAVVTEIRNWYGRLGTKPRIVRELTDSVPAVTDVDHLAEADALATRRAFLRRRFPQRTVDALEAHFVGRAIQDVAADYGVTPARLAQLRTAAAASLASDPAWRALG